MWREIFTSTVPVRIQVVAILGSILIFWSVIHLIRREQLKEGYSIIWFLVGLTLVVLSTITRLLDVLAASIGISYSPAALFLVLTGGLFLLALHFSVLVSKHDRRIRHLAQEHALLRQRLATYESQTTVTAAPDDRP